jgi:UDP-glucose 4-epimerase
MRVLISGGCGFIGSNLVRSLVPHCEVSVIDDFSTGSLKNLDGLPVDLVEGSILNLETVRYAIKGCDAVVHLAARPSVPRSIVDPITSNDVNVAGTLNVLQAARELDDPIVVVASSSSVYGSNPVIPKVESLVPMPMSPYAVSKLATEQYALAWTATYGIPTLAFRFFNVYGPNQSPDHDYAAVIPKFLSAALAGKDLEIHGDGLQSRDFTFVDTVCEVIRRAVTEKITHPTPVNLAFGSRTDLLSVIQIIEDLLGYEVRRKFVDSRVGDVKHSQADNSVLRELFPDVEPVSLRDGLIATIEWMRSRT